MLQVTHVICCSGVLLNQFAIFWSSHYRKQYAYNTKGRTYYDSRLQNPTALQTPAQFWLCIVTEIVLVNEIVGGAETAGYLLKYDSIHGTW